MDTTLLISFGAALFAVVNPVGNLPIFVSFTSDDDKKVQSFLALFFAVWIALTLLAFLFTGEDILKFFGITLPAFRIAGGILLLLTGLSMIRGQVGEKMHAVLTKEESKPFREAERRFRDVMIPLGVPVFVGPGSITTVILYADRAGTKAQMLGLAVVVLLIAAGTGLVLLVARWAQRVLGNTGLDIATRILGLFLAAMGVQFMIDGLDGVTHGLVKSGTAFLGPLDELRTLCSAGRQLTC
ncbi:MAG: MarC family protein [Myxococcota bacterium]